MNIVRLLAIGFCLLTLMGSAVAAPGDTTTVMAHQAVDMTWYGNYDETVAFPNGNTTYRKVVMSYTMGCASGGCSDWDYTTQIFLRRPTGEMDSTVASLDTVSTMPLVVDTTWNVFEVKENMELGRVITPYGTYMANGTSGFDNSWEHRHYFDVTDYVHLLQDTVELRAFYSGWSSGFSVTLRFDFIEGTPPRDVLSIQNLYKGSKGYSSFSDFETTFFTAKTVQAPSNAVGARIFSTITGHGFDNNVGCAGFCSRTYTVNTNSNPLSSATIWKDDCGKNPIYPQGGTWVYDRAGWCPGSKGDIHEFEWSSFNAGAANTIDFDMQNYTWSGTQTPSYTVDAHVVFYGASNHTNDASLEEIIMPNTHEEYSRENPFCGNARIRVKNLGSAPLTSLDVVYGVNGASTCTYSWTGNVAFLEDVVIDLPTLELQGANATNPTFTATLTNVNGTTDEFVHDNTKQSSYLLPDVYTYPFLLLGIRTNNNPQETSYSLTDKDGNVILQRTSSMLTANTIYKDSIFLSDGCYTLTVQDQGGDGLGWWANTAQGSGFIKFFSPFVTFVALETFEIDFGSEFKYNFIMNTADSIQSSCNLITNTTQMEEAPSLSCELYPNPTQGLINIEIGSSKRQAFQYRVLDLLGNVVLSNNLSTTNHQLLQLDLSGQAAGVYLFEVVGDAGERRVQKFVLTK